MQFFLLFFFKNAQKRKQTTPTSDGAEKAESGRLAAVLIQHALLGSLGHWYGDGDGLVEAASSRLDSDDWANRHTIAEQLRHHFRLHWLGLEGEECGQVLH